MGLAASQARLLSLTAQLNDVEFEGQQINQARYALSTQADLFNKLLYDLTPPIPPNKTDFTSITYKFNSNGKDYTVTNIGTVDQNGNAELTTTYKGYGATVNETGEAVKIEGTPKKVKDDSAGTVVRGSLDDIYTDEPYKAFKDAKVYVPGAAYYDGAGNAVDVNAKVEEAMASGQFVNAQGEKINAYQTPMYNTNGEEKFVKEGYFEPQYNEDGSPLLDEKGNHVQTWIEPVSYEPKRYEVGEQVNAEDFFTMYIDNGQIFQQCTDEEAIADPAGFFVGQAAKEITEYTVNGQTPMTTSDLAEDSDVRANIEKAIKQTGKNPEDYYIIPDNSATHGYSLILKRDVMDGNDNAAKLNISDTNSALYEETQMANLEFGTNGRISAINIGTQHLAVEPIVETDEFAYEDAYAAYTYEKQLYDQEQARINAQISIIQRQDKRLELELTELDTRRTEITTELEAVKKVLSEASERGFKTFNG